MENTTESALNGNPLTARDWPSENDLFQKLKSYPFDTDPEFAKGLSIILGHPETPASDVEVRREDDLVLQAKCFYFSRKEKLPSPVNLAAYKAWLKPETIANETSAQQCAASDLSDERPVSEMKPVAHGTQTHTQEPVYPSSFAHIVELITTGQPIPGIQEIPDTVLTGHDTASAKPLRRKPWETGGDQGTDHDK